MLSANNLKTAVIMCKRANCTGEESLEVAQTILALEHALRQRLESDAAAEKAKAEIAEKKVAAAAKRTKGKK